MAQLREQSVPLTVPSGRATVPELDPPDVHLFEGKRGSASSLELLQADQDCRFTDGAQPEETEAHV